MDIQGEIIVCILVAILAVVLVASWFIPTVRETIVELAEPIIATLKRQGKDKIIEKHEEVKRKLSEKIHQLWLQELLSHQVQNSTELIHYGI